jgi:hypothetical protein
MTSTVRIALLLTLTALLPVSAHAADKERERRGRFAEKTDAPRALQPLQLLQAPAPASAVEPRQVHRDARDGGRLSPEERRQLRRDINDAGRDLYRRQRPYRQD